MGPVAQLVFKTSAVVQPTARSVRLRRRSVVMSIDALPEEAEKLLAVPPDEFVSRRAGLVRELRDAGRAEDAATVAGLRKPTVVVFAVNRAARARPKAARSAADAALRVKETQLGNEPDAFKRALGELDDALDLLAQVAIAHVAPSEKSRERCNAAPRSRSSAKRRGR